MYIIVIGSAFDGFSVYGVFKSFGAAAAWAEGEDQPWEIIKVNEVTEDV